MARTSLPIAQGFYVDESLAIAAQECVNFHIRIPANKTLSDASLIGDSGILLAVEADPSSANRGGIEVAGGAYFVNGDTLYRVDYTIDGGSGDRIYAATAIAGDPITGSGPVIMADNGEQICIVAPDDVGNDFNCWVYGITDTVIQVSDVDFDGPVSYVEFMNGYFVFIKSSSNKFFSSDLRDGFSYIATDFASAESDPDNCTALASLNGLLYVFGASTCEQYAVSEGSGFPFVRATSGVIQKGCTAPRSVTEFNGSLVWIGAGENEQPRIWMSSGDLPVPLSNSAIDNLINNAEVEDIPEAFVIKWAEDGHSFLAFTVPNHCTVVYDGHSGLWTTKESIFASSTFPWRVASLVFAYNEFIVGDSLSGNIGLMRSDVYTEFNETINSYFTTPAIDNGGMPFTVNSIELMMQTGVLPADYAGPDPMISMAISKDGGRTYSDPSLKLRSLGEDGDYTRRVVWNILGRYPRSAIFRFTISAPIKRVVVKGEVDIAS